MEDEKDTEKPTFESPQTDMERVHLNKWYVATIVLVLIVGAQILLYLHLNVSYSSREADYKSLISEHRTLTDNYSSLQSSYDSLQDSHSSLQSSYDTYVADYGDLRDQINQHSLHPVVTDFVTPHDATVKSKVLQITGGWSDPSDFNECWEDVKKMYNWVVNNIEYRSDGLYPVIPSTPSGYIRYETEVWQSPSETLDLREGDCEDMAILLTSMIRFYNGQEYWVECIVIRGSKGGHVGVQMPVAGDRLTILDPAGNYYTQTWSGSIDHEDISTEITDWLNYWKSDCGNDVSVEKVFSDDLEKSFSSTSDYTSWMYNR